jgi:hypothetical protein
MAVTYTAGNVMDTAAALLNDAPKTMYSYVVQLPYLKMAQQELEQQLNLHEVPLNLISEYETVVLAGALNPSLPTSFFLPIQLFERANGSVLESDYRLMDEVKDVYELGYDPSTTLGIWDYRHNCINFIGATVNREVRLRYWRQLTVIVDEGSIEQQAGANNYLSFRTAALCARFIMKDEMRADSLDGQAGGSIEVLTALLTKNNQNLRTRRRPFFRGFGDTYIR